MPVKWVATAPPSAELHLLFPDPDKRNDGSEIWMFITNHGKRFAKVVESHGIVTWLREVPE